MHPENDLLWSWDMQENLHKDLNPAFPETKIMKARVLTDIFLIQKKGLYQFQLKFMEQDLVIFNHIMDISEFMNINKMNIENQDENFMGRIIIPRIILKFGFTGMSNEELMIENKIASDIKSIFPNCKYIVLFYYQGIFKEGNERSLNNVFDKIMYFINGKTPAEPIYRRGDMDFYRHDSMKKKYPHLIKYIKTILRNEDIKFLK